MSPLNPRDVMRRASHVSQFAPALSQAMSTVGADHSNVPGLPPIALASPSVVEIGSTGVPNYAGVISEEYLSEVKTPALRYKAYSRMRSDAQVSGLLSIISLPIQSAAFSVEPSPLDDDQARAQAIADFVSENLFRMHSQERGSTFWNDFVRQALLMLAYGFSLFEIVYERVPGERLWRWQKFSPRHWNTITAWNIDNHGELISVTQEVMTGVLSRKAVDIPVESLLRFTWRQEGGNYEGRPLLRDCYKHWWFKDLLYRIQGIGAERMGIGLPVFYIPRDYYADEKDTIISIAKALRVNQEAGLVLPEGYKFDFVEGKPCNYEEAINHHNRMISVTGLAQFLNLGESSSGSFALSKSHGQFFLLAMKGVLDYFVDVVERTAFRRLVDINWGTEVPTPELKHEMIMLDPTQVSDALTTLVLGDLLRPNINDRRVIREQLGLPPAIEGEEEDVIEEEPEDAEMEGEVGASASNPLPDDLRHLCGEHNPNPPGRKGPEFWRPLTTKESASDIRGLKKKWDEFESQLATEVQTELSLEVKIFLESLRRLLREKDIVGISNLRLPRGRLLMGVFEGVGAEAREWARIHAAGNLGVDALPIEHRVLQRLTRNLALIIPKVQQSLETALTRKILTDGGLAHEMGTGVVTNATIERVLAEAGLNFESFKKTQVPSAVSGHINESIRAGRDTLLNNPRVIKAERTEVLDG